VRRALDTVRTVAALVVVALSFVADAVNEARK
jgi:hypothetical protein